MVLSDILGTYMELEKGLPENVPLGPSRDVLRTSKMKVLRKFYKGPDMVLCDVLKLDKGPQRTFPWDHHAIFLERSQNIREITLCRNP
jgi:hypothetical protein